MNRRKFLQTLGIAGGTALVPALSSADEVAGDVEFNAVLVDTADCAGCRVCEAACATAHGLPVPDLSDYSVIEQERTMTTESWTVVNQHETTNGPICVKQQCMHCAQPACAAACLTKAMLKTEEGPVIWRAEKCMGCRYCMISCPFDVPRFEFDSPVPTIQKCNQCWERLQEGEQPACVESCEEEGGGALLFGTRRELIDEARTRIYRRPGRYVHQIYGEREVGGTGYLYLSSVPFEELGFRTDLGQRPYPEYTKGFLYAVPLILVLWPAILYGISESRKRSTGKEGEGELNE